MLLDEGRRPGVVQAAGTAAAAPSRLFLPVWVLFTAAYFALCLQWMRNKALWFDELITWQISQVPLAGLEEALRAGADANPPLFHLFTRLSIALFGNDALGLRMPAAAGYWLMMLCIYLAVRRRCSAVAAWAAAMLPLVWQMRVYAVEARAYGLMLGWAALSLLCWMRATEADGSRRRRWWIAGLALSLAVGVSSHYYGIFAALPVAAGELWRWRRSGRMDWPVALTPLAMAVPLAACLPLMEAARQYGADAWSEPAASMIPWTYVSLMGQASGTLGLMVALAVVAAAVLGRRGQNDFEPVRWPGHWVIATAALVLLPVAAVMFSMIVTKAFVVRYAGITLIGFALAAGLGVEWMRRRFGPAIAVALALSMTALGGYHFWKETRRREPLATEVWVPMAERYQELPVVLDTMLYYEALYYTPAGMQARVLVVADPVEARRQSGSSAAEAGLRNMAKVRPLPGLVDYAGLVRLHQTFLHVSDTTRNPWLVNRLIADGAEVRVLAMGPVMVHLVRIPPKLTGVAKNGLTKPVGCSGECESEVARTYLSP